jgi:hypothetical protein
MHGQEGMPFSIFAMLDSVMTRPSAVRCGKPRPVVFDTRRVGAPRVHCGRREFALTHFLSKSNSGKQDARAEAIYTKEAGAAGYDRQGHASRHSVPQGISRSRRRVASRPRG